LGTQQALEHKARHIGKQPDEGGDGVGVNQRHLKAVRQAIAFVPDPGGQSDGQRHRPHDQQAVQQGFALLGREPGEEAVQCHAMFRAFV
jgi:hypothetical protein